MQHCIVQDSKICIQCTWYSFWKRVESVLGDKFSMMIGLWLKATSPPNWFEGISSCRPYSTLLISLRIGHVNEYPTIHYFRNPGHLQSMKAYTVRFCLSGSVDKACGSWSMGRGFESHQGHWWCQEGHPTTIAPVLQRRISPKTCSEKSPIRVSHRVWRLETDVSFF